MHKMGMLYYLGLNHVYHLNKYNIISELYDKQINWEGEIENNISILSVKSKEINLQLLEMPDTNAASAANDTLDSVKLFDFGSIPKTHSNDAYCKDGSWHVWKPIPEYPTVKFYYLDGGECIISSIAGFMIPIHKEGNVLHNKCFCTSLWDYLMDTIACAPAYSNMMVGGSSSSSNTAAELVNRYLKYIEGFKYMRVDNYLTNCIEFLVGYYADQESVLSSMCGQHLLLQSVSCRKRLQWD
eukprot:761570_1